MGEREGMVGPTSLVVRVVRPSGKAIEDADVRIEWEDAESVDFGEAASGRQGPA